MVTREDLKQIIMLTDLTDPMLDRLATIIDVLHFGEREVIFRANDPCDRFYMVRSGAVLLEQKITDEVTAFVGQINPGFSFGWSMMIDDSTYTVDAVSQEPSEVYSFNRDQILRLFELDSEMALRMYKRVLVIMKKRLAYRTQQFQKAIINHPDLQELFRR